ncbi:uncharacterized protein V6R79_006595 [Siganus canaliculatus]
MSSNYSANQYDSAFRSKRLQNWCETKPTEEKPTAHRGHTTFIANDRGHLLPGVKKGSAWPDFKGTWDLPTRIPAHRIDPTGRSVEGLQRLKAWGFDTQKAGNSCLREGVQNIDELQTSADLQRHGSASSFTSESRPTSQNPIITEGQNTARQSQDFHAAEVRSIGSPAESESLVSQHTAAEENPAASPAAGE